MQNKFTPGPWMASQAPHPDFPDHIGYQVSTPEGTICEMHVRSYQPVFINAANARLIAAAPELYEALQLLTLAVECGGTKAELDDATERADGVLRRAVTP